MSVKPTLRIIRPSSREEPNLLSGRLKDIQDAGFHVLYEELEPDPDWAYASGTIKDRVTSLTKAICEPDSDIVFCARGGYGASDLLPHLPWPTFAALPAKLIVGFSDISALHSAFYTRLGWPGLHAPMPATALWGRDGQIDDIQALYTNLRQWHAGGTSGSLPITGYQQAGGGSIDGPLFGGCFTVLTNLIGTSYAPGSLAGHILFIEDTGEHPARLMRALNQWQQAGLLREVKALIIGYLRHLGSEIPDNADFVIRQFAARTDLPVYHTALFGHTSPNYPMMVGAPARINLNRLTWQLQRVRQTQV